MTAIPPRKSRTTAEPETSSDDSRKLVRRRLLILLAVLAGSAVVFAPVFVAKSPLREQILPMLLPDYPGEIRTGRCSLFWWSKVELGGVAFYDLDGEPMLAVEKITSEKSLAALLADQVRVGGFLIHRPRLTVRMEDAGSNLERTLAPIFASDDSEGLDCSFHVRQGQVEIVDQRNRTTQIANFEADVRLPIDPSEAVTVRGAFEVNSAEGVGRAGTVDFEVSHRSMAEEDGTKSQSGTLRLKTRDLRLEALAGLFGRLGNGVEITGVFVSDLAAEWSVGEMPLAFQVQGGLSATGFSLEAPDWMRGDRFVLEYLSHQGKIEYHAGQVDLADWSLKSDVLDLEADGVLDIPQLLTAWNDPSAKIPLEEFHLEGEADVARLAGMLPETLRLRDGLEIRSGKLLMALDADRQNNERHLTGKISTSRIAATAGGKEIVWDEPLELSLKARGTSAGPVLDELNCRSDFLSLSAQGTPENASFKASCRLDALLTELNRFADLDEYRLSGQIDAGLTLRRLGPELVRGAASAVIKDLEFRRPGEPAESAWKETQLILAAGGDIVSPPAKPQELRNLSVRLASGGDVLELSQTEPVSLSGGWPEIALAAEVRGDLESWRHRLRPFVSMENWQSAGSFIATAKARLSPRRASLEQVIADVQGLSLQSAAVNLRESRVHVETRADWSAEARKLRLPRFTWASPSLSLRAEDVEYIISAEGNARTSGRLVFRGGVSELGRWFGIEKALGTDFDLAGTASGQIDAILTAKAADANWNLIIENGTLSKLTRLEPPPGPAFRNVSPSPERETIWQEDRMALRGGGVYHFGADRLELRPTLLEAPWLSVTAKGTLDEATTRGAANLTGTMTCDLALLAERYRKTLGEDFQMAGSESRPFSIRGPIWGAAENERVANDLSATLSLPWKRIEAYGVPIGPGELRADLNLGKLLLGPLDVPLSNGRLRLKSQLAVNSPELAVRIEKGPILENVRLTPDISRQWMKYAVPLLADVTETQGQFSFSLSTDGVIPLENPRAMTASGVLTIESARMQPGRLADAFLDVVKQVKSIVRGRPAGGVLPADEALIRLDKQSVNVQCSGGRVYHRNLKMVLADIPVTTSGSVGLDETLSLTAEIPIQADWVADTRLLKGLEGQSLKIPVTGTLSQPVLDTRAVFAALQKAARNATGRLIEEELKDQLDRLFDRR